MHFFFNSRVFCQPIDRFLRMGVTRVTIKAVPIIFYAACITLKQTTDKTKLTDEENKEKSNNTAQQLGAQNLIHNSKDMWLKLRDLLLPLAKSTLVRKYQRRKVTHSGRHRFCYMPS